jgi:hypothetical protein
MLHSRSVLVLAVLIHILTFPFTANSQSVPTDSIKYGVLPALGYSSDTGFVGGGIVSRYHYREQIEPFHNFAQVAALATTRGLFSLLVTYEQLEPFSLPGYRTRNILMAGRILESTYFGIGQQTPFSRDLWDDGYYYFESYYFNLESRVRKTLWQGSGKHPAKIDAVILSDIRQMAPQLKTGGNLLAESALPSKSGGWSWMGGIGVQWENRDNEFAPTRGNTLLFEFRGSPGIASDYSLYHVNLLASQFATTKIIFPVTAALKIGYMHSGGDVPFFILPEIGGEYTLRGYPQGRFRHDAALYYTTELRTWLFEAPSAGFRLGGQLFVDGGRVYRSGEVISEFFSRHNYAYGLGAAMSVFTYDFIVRADLGFSDEISRLYLGIGYTF